MHGFEANHWVCDCVPVLNSYTIESVRLWSVLWISCRFFLLLCDTSEIILQNVLYNSCNISKTCITFPVMLYFWIENKYNTWIFPRTMKQVFASCAPLPVRCSKCFMEHTHTHHNSVHRITIKLSQMHYKIFSLRTIYFPLSAAY